MEISEFNEFSESDKIMVRELGIKTVAVDLLVAWLRHLLTK